jgi:hypothetical protein
MRNLLSKFRLALEERRAAVIFGLAIILLTSGFAEAQSGRRPPKKTESEGVQRSSETVPEIKPEAKQPEKERTPVLIVKANSYFNTFYVADYIVEGCAARLKQAASLQIAKSTKDMNRKEASDAAMAPTIRYVVFLDITSERMRYGRQTRGQDQIDDVVIDYTIFSPGTGKVKSSGRVYQMRPRSTVGGVGVPLPVPNGPAAAEQSLRQAGRDVADRVISSLGALPASWN